MDPLDPGWAAIIGAGIGALATALGSAVGPIVRDSIARRATNADNARDTRRKLAMQLIDALDAVTEASGRQVIERVKVLTRLTAEVSLIDGRGELPVIIEFATLYLRADEDLVRTMVASYTQNVVTKWGRSEAIPSAQEFVDQALRLVELMRDSKAAQTEDPTKG